MSDTNYIPNYGRILDEKGQTWRLLKDPKECKDTIIVGLEEKYYILKDPLEKKEISLSEVESLKVKRRIEIGEMARYICKTWADDPIKALKDWISGEGWRAPERIWPALGELCQEHITDPNKLECARLYFNDEFIPFKVL